MAEVTHVAQRGLPWAGSLDAAPRELENTVAGGVAWRLRAGLIPRLLDQDGLRLPQWLAAGQATVVKTGPHRIVYRVQLPDLTFFIKHNLAPDWRARLRHLLRGSKARLEFDKIQTVTQRGIPTVVPLGFGESARWGNGQSYLLTLALDRVEAFSDFLQHTFFQLSPARQIRVRKTLAVELGRWIAGLHDAGIRQDDFHPGNILIRMLPEDRVAFFPVDLNSVRLRPPLPLQESQENLVILNRWFSLRASRADRLRCWQAYSQAREAHRTALAGCGPRAYLHAARALEQRTLDSNLGFWNGRDQRCLNNNRYYRKVRGVRMQGHAVTDLDPGTVRSFLQDPDAPFRQPHAVLLKDSRSSTVAELEVLVGGVLRKVIYKRFRVRTLAEPLRNLVRRTPALRSWVYGQGFCERGLPTPRPLLVLHRRRLGLSFEGYLLTEKVENAENLVEFVNQVQNLPVPQRQQALRVQVLQVAKILRELHRRRLYHRDLKAHNVLVSRAPRVLTCPGSSASLGLLPYLPSCIWIIDLVGVEQYRRLSWSRRVQNLARMNASFFRNPALSRTDRLRFLRHYLQWSLFGKGQWKMWWRAIEQTTQAKVQRNRRRGRPIA